MKNNYHHTKITKIDEHNEDYRSFTLDTILDSKAGQFVMVCLPGVDEKPFSLSAPNRITVKKVGPFTEKFFEKKEGDSLGIRGPYGNGFPSSYLNTAIGGGCGIAPLMHLVSGGSTPQVTKFVLAGKTKSELLFLEDITKALENNRSYEKTEIITVTDDGSHGTKGVASDLVLPKSEHNYFICGPEVMMQKVAEKLVATEVDPSKIFLSLERYMKCAVGLCGNCLVSGYRVCADGPVFGYDTVKDLRHFNKYERTRTGELVKK